MPVLPLARDASLDHLRRRVKDLRRRLAARDPAAAHLIREFHPRHHTSSDDAIFTVPAKLGDARLVIARSHGFVSWASLRRHIETPSPAADYTLSYYDRIADEHFVQALRIMDAGDAASLRAHLEAHPVLVRQRVAFEGQNYFRNPALLEFIAENPVRQNTMPANVVEIAAILLDAGAQLDRASVQETLMLVATGSVARETGHQRPLIDLLVARGADPDRALRIALVLREIDSAHRLMELGAVLDLPAAASFGRTEDARRLLPGADGGDRHLALSQAAQFGHTDVVRLLLEAGEDPNRYNPPGGHSHATPLHQAAAFGHLDVARLLIQYGARPDMKDTLWRATPAEWARHGGNAAMERYLLAGRQGSDEAALEPP